MCPCRGRRRGRRWISEVPPVRCFVAEGPRDIKEPEEICLTLEELETVRLVDLLDLDQEEAAFYMGISRKAFWNDLMNARKKIAAALVYGTGLRIEGGSFILRGAKGDENAMNDARRQEIELMERELRLLKSRTEQLNLKMAALQSPNENVS
ncbi:MAG TPA: DUF134 domain-containing protein [Methanothrix sp.]|nr:DUF134 domain-containing protein [Methanothrix sp.]